MGEAREIQTRDDIPGLDRSEKTILVVEDDRTHRTLMEKILKECAFKTIPAENGIIALSKFGSGQKFDLIIMDWDMPEMNGLETVQTIRAIEVKENLGHTPIIAFTANKDPGDREKCLAAGMDAYLPKDVWMPKWRGSLIDNLQGLIAGDFRARDFDNSSRPAETVNVDFDLDAFDIQAIEQAATLLKNELAIAIDEYLEDAAAYIRDIQEGLETNNVEKTARASHPLKSNSKSFGLTGVSQLAEAINATTKKGNVDTAKPLLPQLQEAFYRAEKKLHDFMKRAGY